MILNPGATFKIDSADVPDWLWIVICRDDAADSELVAGIVPSPHKSFDPACEIGASEHEALLRHSFVNYAQAKVLTPSRRAAVADFFLDYGNISEAMLLRVQQGCIDSDHAYGEHKAMVRRLVPEIR